MNEPTGSFWQNVWGRPRRFFTRATILSLLASIGFGLVIGRLGYQKKPIDTWILPMCITMAAFILSFVGLILSVIPCTQPGMSWILRRWFFSSAALATFIALFYAEENWRGQRALDRAKQEIIAKGVVLDWDKYIPPAVPDDQNVFKAPNIQQWFVGRGSPGLTFPGQTNFPIWGTSRKIATETEARDYLKWSDQFQPQFTMLRDALKRPYSRMDGDYANIMTLPIPNFVAIRELARIQAQRTHCYLIVNEPDKAVAELAFMHDLSHFTDSQPTGKPMTLVAAMINVAVVGVYADVIGEGLQTHAWKEPQLAALQKQLSEVHTMPAVAEAFQSEPAASARALEIMPAREILSAFQAPGETRVRILFSVAPRGWLLQNIASEIPFRYAPGEAIDTEHERVSPGVLKDNQARLEQFVSRSSPFRILTAMAVPNFQKAVQTMARNQTAVDEAFIVCGLERYRLANGPYPDSLDALVPKFLDKLPNDIITGEPLKYRRTGDSFLLYSIGWNEKDDGGMTPPTADTAKPDAREGDWVWQFAAK